MNKKSNSSEITIKECLLEGLEMLKKHWPVLLLAEVIFHIYNMLTEGIPVESVFSVLNRLITYPLLLAGYWMLLLNTGRDSCPSIKDLLKGFHQFWLSIRIYWFIGIVMSIFYLPFFIYISKDSYLYHQVHDTLLVLSKAHFFLLFPFTIVFLIFIRYSFIFLILVDTPRRTFVEIFKDSSFLIYGHKQNIMRLYFLHMLSTLIFLYIFSLTDIKIIPIEIQSFEYYNYSIDSNRSILLSLVYYTLNFFFVIFYLSFVRFYEKLKQIKNPPPKIAN